jgi:hypothetical protein
MEYDAVDHQELIIDTKDKRIIAKFPYPMTLKEEDKTLILAKGFLDLVNALKGD